MTPRAGVVIGILIDSASFHFVHFLFTDSFTDNDLLDHIVTFVAMDDGCEHIRRDSVVVIIRH